MNVYPFIAAEQAGKHSVMAVKRCQYIDDALTAAGVDLSAVASRSGIHRDDITDEWREW